MSSNQWTLTASDLFNAGPVVPVIVITKIEQALPLAKALLDGGINVMEVTLRTDCGLQAIADIAKAYPDSLIGAGTVINPAQLTQVAQAGAKFAISPGSTNALLEAGQAGHIPFIPGVVSSSELMNAQAHGYDHFKFFPAESNGGVKALKALGAPFQGIKICPTGGISLNNAPDYLALDIVDCIGGSWIVPVDLVEAGQWDEITQLCKEAVAALSK
jgi:2-dehydro-3-deoxyphosphogluconate aldolase/(4S)-4-hydroxy-2-oxoglutarate aldolase